MTIALHMLDTDTASFIIKGRSPQIEVRLADIPPDRLCVSAITRAELMYGLRRIPAGHRLQVGVRAFLKIVAVLAWGADAADYYADIRHQLTSIGQPIGDMDMMIAAHALAVGAVLVTNNTKHFGRIAAPLALVNWLEGAG
jgi:tRNA(fMet)-specific endonuclease VapC